MEKKQNTFPQDLPYFSRWYGALFRKAQAYMREAFKDMDLAFVDVAIFLFVWDNNGVSQEEIAFKMSFDKGAVTRSLKILEQKKLIIRKVSPDDNRIKQVYTTKKADNYAQTMRIAMQKWHETVVADLTEEEVKYTLQGLQKMANTAALIDVKLLLNTPSHTNIQDK